jgi:addiction module HigA family antidote
MGERKMKPIHPGEILLEEFLKLMAISPDRLAKDISVPGRRVNEIVQGKRGINADTLLRLARYFGTSERFWMNLQARYDLEVELRIVWANAWKKRFASTTLNSRPLAELVAMAVEGCAA